MWCSIIFSTMPSELSSIVGGAKSSAASLVPSVAPIFVVATATIPPSSYSALATRPHFAEIVRGWVVAIPDPRLVPCTEVVAWC